jgi:hypothetical protein
MSSFKLLIAVPLLIFNMTPANADPSSCSMVFNAKAAEKSAGVAPSKVTKSANAQAHLDLIERYETGRASQAELVSVRAAASEMFYGKPEIFFSLHQLMAYDETVASYGVHPFLKPELVPEGISFAERVKFWLGERSKYSKRLKEFSKRLEKMTVAERKAVAKTLTAKMFEGAREKTFFKGEDYSHEIKRLVLLKYKRLPIPSIEALSAARTAQQKYAAGMDREALELLVYESLIPLSKLAITDRLTDRVGGRTAFTSSTTTGQRWIRALATMAAVTTSFILLGNHELSIGHEGWATTSYLLGAGIGSIVSGITAGYQSHRVMNKVMRLPESAQDAFATLRERIAKAALWRRMKRAPELPPVESPTQSIEAALLNLKIETLSAKSDWGNQTRGLNEYGTELQTAVSLIVDLHMNLKFEQADQIENVTPLLKELRKKNESKGQLRESLRSNQFAKLENELTQLDSQYFNNVQAVIRMRRDLVTVDNKIGEYLAVLEDIAKQAPKDELLLLNHRMASLTQSKTMVQIQLSAMDLSEKNLMENLTTVEALRSILIAYRSGSTVEMGGSNDALREIIEKFQKNVSR